MKDAEISRGGTGYGFWRDGTSIIQSKSRVVSGFAARPRNDFCGAKQRERLVKGVSLNEPGHNVHEVREPVLLTMSDMRMAS